MDDRNRRGGGYVGNWTVCSYLRLHCSLVGDELLASFEKEASKTC